MALRENYKDDVFTGERKYTLINNPDGTISLVDDTAYEEEGDTFGALDINATNKVVNDMNSLVDKTLSTTWSLDSALNKYYQDITISGLTTDNQIDILSNCATLTKEQEETYLEEYMKLCANCDARNGYLRVFANEQLSSAISISLRLVK